MESPIAWRNTTDMKKESNYKTCWIWIAKCPVEITAFLTPTPGDAWFAAVSFAKAYCNARLFSLGHLCLDLEQVAKECIFAWLVSIYSLVFQKKYLWKSTRGNMYKNWCLLRTPSLTWYGLCDGILQDVEIYLYALCVSNL